MTEEAYTVFFNKTLFSFCGVVILAHIHSLHVQYNVSGFINFCNSYTAYSTRE
jgi:hypothetical protein